MTVFRSLCEARELNLIAEGKAMIAELHRLGWSVFPIAVKGRGGATMSTAELNGPKVSSDQRFTAARPCPVCGGHEGLPRGQEKRCAGYLSGNGRFAFCERKEAAERVASGPLTLFKHRIVPVGAPARSAGEGKRKAPGHRTPQEAIRSLAAWMKRENRVDLGTLSGHWDYHDRRGRPCMVIFRFDAQDGSKTYRPVHRGDDDQWRTGDPEGPLPLYRLPDLADADPVVITEGEKAAVAVDLLGMVATTPAHGAKSPQRTDWSPLAGKDVVILPDNDPPGRAFKDAVVDLLSKLDPPPRVKVVDLPGLPEKGDAHDFLDMGGTGDRLRELIASAPTIEAKVGPGPGPESPGPVADDWLEAGDIATLADVEAELGDAQFLWDYWIQFGAMTAVIAEAGSGKTRTVVEWAARLWHGHPMPDGSPNPLPAGTKTLWLCYDRNWRGLIKTAREFGLPVEAILLPTHRKKPLWIPDFDDPKTIALLGAIIRKHTPGFVAIDTTTYATSFNTAKAHETKLAFDPLMGVMVETKTACIAITHTNAQGEILNRRLRERVRTEIKISRPDPDQGDRLRLECRKTEDKKPPPLGMTFRDGGIDYDDAPPSEPEAPQRGPKPEKSTGLAAWLWDYLQPSAAPIVDIINAARDAGKLPQPTAKNPKPSISSLYDARDRIPRLHPGKTIDQFEAMTEKGRALKHWCIAEVGVGSGGLGPEGEGAGGITPDDVRPF